MKLSNCVTGKSIFTVVIFQLLFAVAIAFFGIAIEINSATPNDLSASLGNLSLFSYVLAGVTGNIPSVSGTLQKIALAVAYVLTPTVAFGMYAAQLNTARTPADKAHSN